MLLDGIWNFRWQEELPEGEAVSYSGFSSDFAAVPGCFDAVGLKYPQCGTGYYSRKVYAGGKLRLKIASFGLHCVVSWDGKIIGESYFSWSPLVVDFESEEGEHELCIAVDNIMKNHPLFRNFYDFYNFGGIYDHVTLENIFENEIRYLAVLPIDHTTGEVELCVETDAEKIDVSFDGKFFKSYPNFTSIRMNVPNFKVWSPENPELHTVTVNEKTVTFGIRTLDWSGKTLKLNGREIKLIGVNRHESHPEFGAATPESLIASDLQQIKEAGFNFVRGSHYPQREFFFDMCDRLGLLVWEEPLSWGNNEDDLKSQKFMDSLAQQLTLTIRNSINHPSLIIHGFLNECASDTQSGYAAVRRLMNICHAEDPTRPATFASNRPGSDICFDLVDVIAINIYPAWYGSDHLEDIPRILDEYAEKLNSKALFISEIGAAAMLGDHSGNPWSEEYQFELTDIVLECVRKNPAWSGVMYWLYCNANTYIDSARARFRPRGFNNKGMLDEYRRPKLAWQKISEKLNG